MGGESKKGEMAKAQQGGHVPWPGLASSLGGPRRRKGASFPPASRASSSKASPAVSHHPTLSPPALPSRLRPGSPTRQGHAPSSKPPHGDLIPTGRKEEGRQRRRPRKPSHRGHQAFSPQTLGQPETAPRETPKTSLSRTTILEPSPFRGVSPRSACQGYCNDNNNNYNGYQFTKTPSSDRCGDRVPLPCTQC